MKIITLVSLLLFTVSAFGTEKLQNPTNLENFLRANNLPENTIQQIVNQELQDPYKLRGAKVLSPYLVLQASHVELPAIKAQYARVHKTHVALGISAALAAAGVICFFAPLPGTSAFAVILLKNSIAVAATVSAVTAGGAFYANRVSEVRSLKDIEKVLTLTLNQIIAHTYVQDEVGTIVSVDLSKNEGIKGFHTSEGFDFEAETLAQGERVFVSYTSWRRHFEVQRWFRDSADFDGKVISLVDFTLYPLSTYEKLTLLSAKPNLSPQEEFEYAHLVCVQIALAKAYRKDTFNIDVGQFKQLCGSAHTLNNGHPSAQISEILQGVLTLRDQI